MELVCFKLVVIGMGVDVDVDEIGEVFEDVGHGCELVALLWEGYFIISSWLLIVRETRFRKVLELGATNLGLRAVGRFLWLHLGRSTLEYCDFEADCDSNVADVMFNDRF
jgi:hypothetical protein